MEEDIKQERELREQAVRAAITYYEFKHKNSKPFAPGDRIPYAARAFKPYGITRQILSVQEDTLPSARNSFDA